MKRIPVLLAGAALAGGAAAGFDSGNRLHEDCASANYFNRGYCGGYIVGIVDASESAGEQRAGAAQFCIPDGVTKGQLTDVVRKYLHDNPESRHLDAARLVPSALQQAFPCAGDAR